MHYHPSAASGSACTCLHASTCLPQQHAFCLALLPMVGMVATMPIGTSWYPSSDVIPTFPLQKHAAVCAAGAAWNDLYFLVHDGRVLGPWTGACSSQQAPYEPGRRVCRAEQHPVHFWRCVWRTCCWITVLLQVELTLAAP